MPRFRDRFSLNKSECSRISTNFNCDMQVLPFNGVKPTSSRKSELCGLVFAYVCLPSRLVVISVVIDYFFKRIQFPPLSNRNAESSFEVNLSLDLLGHNWQSENMKKAFPSHFRNLLLCRCI